ncbi:MAG: WYL domain-containing protein [Spirochaetes bacterium]|nr:WYL domain-containing protein [Spirochaetota bacterium]
MSKFKPQFGRLLFIDKKLRAGLYPNSTSLAREYEVSPRTILRDIDFMRDMLDAPIEYDAERRGFHYTEESYSLPNIAIRESDLFAICIAEKALEQYANTPLYDKLSSVFEKLRSFLPDSVTVRPGWIDNRFTFLSESFTAIDPAIWETVAEGLRASRRVVITHRKAGGEATTRAVSPYHMVNYRGEWYLVGRCSVRESVLRFAMSRIRSAVLTDQAFDIPADFDFRTYLGSHFGIMTEDEDRRVTIEFSPAQAPYVEERTWHSGQTVTRRDDGSILLSFTTNSLFEVKRWVLSWGAGARVIEPESLARQVREEMESALRRYDHQP